MPEHQQAQKSTESKANTQTRNIPPKQFPTSHPAAIIQRARINPKSLTHADVMQLQRTIGNQAVGRLLSEIGLIPSKAKQTQPVQMQTIPEEEKESLQGKFAEPLQRQEIPEEEEPLQGKFESGHDKEICPSCIQMQEIPEEEDPLQGKMDKTIQLQEIPEEEEPLQGKFERIQRQEIQDEEPLQIKRENNTGMPDNLKAGMENLSGIDMSDVRVHYNSSKPAEVGALAYTQGTNIHIAQGQERHLPHETWHVVQQAQGRVKPTFQKKGVAINDDVEMEREADEMGGKVRQMKHEVYSNAKYDLYRIQSGYKSVPIQLSRPSRQAEAEMKKNFPELGAEVPRAPRGSRAAVVPRAPPSWAGVAAAAPVSSTVPRSLPQSRQPEEQSADVPNLAFINMLISSPRGDFSVKDIVVAKVTEETIDYKIFVLGPIEEVQGSRLGFRKLYTLYLHLHPVPKTLNWLHIKKAEGGDPSNQVTSDNWLLQRHLSVLRTGLASWEKAFPGAVPTIKL